MNIFLISLGCAKNRVDSEMVVGILEKNGNKLVEDAKDADILMVNTCAFIEDARKEAIDTILSLASIKTKTQKLVVLGCLPQRYKEEIISLLPEVDRFIRIDEYKDICTIFNNLLNNNYHFKGEISPLIKHISTPNYMRYIKISEGCLNRCAFCAIPLIRGNLRSRTIEDIYEEVKLSINEGAYEINLISQDTTRYGFDIYKQNSIVKLLEKLTTIEGNYKIRLLYLYPDIVTDELINFIKNNDKVMPYFDVPIQHSEDNILSLMKRRGNREYLLNLFSKIKKEIPHSILRTTLIVGFPHETNEDINSLLEFIENVRFDRLGAFTFSKEENTLAATYDNDISEVEKQARYDLVMKTQAKISLENNFKYLNTVLEDCFIIDYSEEDYMYVARNYMFAPDDIDGVIYIAAKKEHNLGDLVKVKILDANEYVLIGEEVE